MLRAIKNNFYLDYLISILSIQKCFGLLKKKEKLILCSHMLAFSH